MNQRLLALLSIAFMLLGAYFPVLTNSRIVDLDAHLILPALEATQGLGAYLKALFGYTTYDFQPMRDLTLYLDLQAWRLWHINVSVWQNMAWWLLLVAGVERLLLFECTLLPRNRRWALVALFALYPLFCATLPWGMARKHILSSAFTVWASVTWISMLRSPKEKKTSWASSILYTLAVLSQPLNLLWPLWAFAYAKLNRFKTYRWTLLVPSLAVMVVGILINNSYYAQSATFQSHYASKTSDLFNFADKILGLGFYGFQLAWPYELATSYDLGHASVLVGIGLWLVLSIAIWRSPQKFQQLSWLIFALAPLFIVLADPHFLSDTYLLIPAVGVFIILCLFLRTHWSRTLVVCLALPWGWSTHQESKLWLDPIKFSNERNFLRRPNCDSAIKLAQKSFALTGHASEDVRAFLMGQGCLKVRVDSPDHALSALQLKSYLLYTDRTLSPELKIKYMQGYAQSNYFPKLLLVLMFFQSGREGDARTALREIASEKSQINWGEYRDEILATQLWPYCRKTQDQDCLEVVGHFIRQPDVPYL